LYLIFISLGFIWAFLTNRYATRTYPISASILFFAKDETSSGAELLYRNALLNTKRNYLNDPYLMKSNLIVKRVVEELSFNVQVILDGDISSSELYDLPFKITCPTFDQSGQYEFIVLSEKKFRIDYLTKLENVSRSQEFEFNTKFSFDGKEFLVSVLDQQQLLAYRGKLLRVVVNTSNSIAESYSDQLVLRWAEEGSGVMNISVFGSTPQKEVDFINGVIKSYQRYDLDNKNRTADRTVEFIKSQLQIISDSLRQFEVQLERFKQDKHTNGDFNSDAQRMFARAEGFETQKATLLLRNSYYNYLKNYLEKEEDLHQAIVPSSLELNDPILTGLLGKIMDIQLDTKLFFEKNNKGKGNPLIENKLERIATLKKEITESMNNQRNLDKIKIDYLTDQVKAIDKLFEAIPFNQRKLVSITRKYKL